MPDEPFLPCNLEKAFEFTTSPLAPALLYSTGEAFPPDRVSFLVVGNTIAE